MAEKLAGDLFFRAVGPMVRNLAQFREAEEDEDFRELIVGRSNFASSFLMPVTSTATAILSHQETEFEVDEEAKMLSAEYFGSLFSVVNNVHADGDVQKSGVFESKAGGVTVIMNASLNATADSTGELFYRHSMAMTAVYCIAYLIVFAVGIIGNFFVIAVVFRTPRMRTVTNFFIVNLAVADILVIIFCLPATLMSNIFVRK